MLNPLTSKLVTSTERGKFLGDESKRSIKNSPKFNQLDILMPFCEMLVFHTWVGNLELPKANFCESLKDKNQAT